jgi:hypothetical protein
MLIVNLGLGKRKKQQLLPVLRKYEQYLLQMSFIIV